MLYVDGMNAVIEQNEVVQWLYSLVDSSVRVVTFTNFSLEKVFVMLFLVSTCCENELKTFDYFR